MCTLADSIYTPLQENNISANLNWSKTQSAAAGVSRNIEDYKRSASDSILDATANCIATIDETHPQISLQDRSKFCQEMAAQASKKGGIYHVTALNASVQEPEVPAWHRTMDHTFNKAEDYLTHKPVEEQIKSGSIEDSNIPYFLKFDNKLTQAMDELNNNQTAKPVEPETPIKSAAIPEENNTTTETHGHFKRIANIMGEGHFV